MVRVYVIRNPGGAPVSVEISGHSNFAPHGSDIVCAAVSMLTQTIIFAIEDLLQMDSGAVVEEGYVQLTLPSNVEPNRKEKLLLLVETLLLGLKETKNAYPDFIQYSEERKPGEK